MCGSDLSSLVPRPFLPPVFVCDQKLEVGTAWERGYDLSGAQVPSLIPRTKST